MCTEEFDTIEFRELNEVEFMEQNFIQCSHSSILTNSQTFPYLSQNQNYNFPNQFYI